MNGLEKWMRANGTCPAEIFTLSKAGGLEPDDMLGAEKNAAELSGGKATALTAMLERGRNGEMMTGLATFAKYADVEMSAVIDAAASLGLSDNDMVKDTDGTISGIKSSALPKLVEILNVGLSTDEDTEPAGSAEPDAPAENAGAPADGNSDDKTPAPAGKPKSGRSKTKTTDPALVMAPRRKTKYSINKAMVNELFRCTDMPFDGVELRRFLLSLPEYKPQDVALMSDVKVNEIIEKNFVAVKLGESAVLMSAGSWLSLVNVLTANDAYYIPAETAAEPEE